MIIDSYHFKADVIPTAHSWISLIRGAKGILGCGYINIETAEKFGDAMAIVTGVTNCEEMLEAKVKKVSSAALALGVQVGMSGKEALLLMK